MFEMNSRYELEHEYSRKLTELSGSIEIMGVSTNPDEDVNEILVYYTVRASGSNRGQVLITNMKDNRGVNTYYFQPEQLEISGNQQEMFLMEFAREDDYFLFGGKANYLRGTGDQLSIIIDWTTKDAYFGFFMVWTAADHCQTPDDRIVLDYGPTYPTDYEEIEQVNYLRIKTAEFA